MVSLQGKAFLMRRALRYLGCAFTIYDSEAFIKQRTPSRGIELSLRLVQKTPLMAPKRRDRRPAGGGSNSDRPSRSGHPVEEPRTARANGSHLPLYSIVVLLFFLGSAYRIYRSSPVQSVYDRGLVKSNVDYQEIIRVRIFDA